MTESRDRFIRQLEEAADDIANVPLAELQGVLRRQEERQED